MKRLIALLIALVFLISIFATPASAVCPNPNDARFVRGGTPYGDEGGWHEIDSDSGKGIVGIFSSLKILTYKYTVIYFVPKVVEKPKPLVEHEPAGTSNTHRDRSTSSE